MIKYIFKRLLQLIPILIGITFLSFAMMRLAGGVWISHFLFSMRNGLQEWQPEIWARATYPNEMFMKHL